jgi:hypothetical protein
MPFFFCDRCVVCRRAKIRPYMAATLYPLLVPPRPWHTFGLGDLTYLHVSNGFANVMIVVDHVIRNGPFSAVYTKRNSKGSCQFVFKGSI